jgi:hypothetical protein
MRDKSFFCDEIPQYLLWLRQYLLCSRCYTIVISSKVFLFFFKSDLRFVFFNSNWPKAKIYLTKEEQNVLWYNTLGVTWKLNLWANSLIPFPSWANEQLCREVRISISCGPLWSLSYMFCLLGCAPAKARHAGLPPAADVHALPPLPQHSTLWRKCCPSTTDDELQSKTVQSSKLTSMGYSVVNSLEIWN